ncbi:hypothetical protein [Enterococcus dispar]
MGLFDFFSNMKEIADKYSAPDYLKMDVEVSTRVKKRLTSLESTVRDMKALDNKLKQELEQAEALKYGRAETPSYSGLEFEQFLDAAGELAEERTKVKTVEQVSLELKEFSCYKELFLKDKLTEIESDMSVLKTEQTAKLREIESGLETVNNADAINVVYAELVNDYHKLVQRVKLLAQYCPNYYYATAYERIEHKSIKEQQSESVKYTAQKDKAYWDMYNEAHSGLKVL